jgi:hypothetical protein
MTNTIGKLHSIRQAYMYIGVKENETTHTSMSVGSTVGRGGVVVASLP